MRILLLTQLFQPEPNHLKGLGYARELIRLGHSVQVLTGFPNYPGGKVYDGYKIRVRQREIMDGVEIVRVAHYPSHDSSGARRFLNYATFALMASTIGLVSVRRPDIVHVYQGPATLMVPAFLMKLFFGSFIVLDVQDLWPESVLSSGMLKLPAGYWLLHQWSKLTYKISDIIVTLSSGYKDLLKQRGVDEIKIHVVYNWCEESSIQSVERNDKIESRYKLAGKFNIIFAGTMGAVQALDAVLDSAEMIKTELPDVQFVFVGGGIDVENLKMIASEKKLTNVLFIPRQRTSEISVILAFADALLIHIRDDELGRISIPQKTQASLAAGKPIIMAVAGESAEIVKRAKAGIICLAQNPDSITQAVREMLSLPVEKRMEMGNNGRQYYLANMSFKIGVRKMINLYLIYLKGAE